MAVRGVQWKEHRPWGEPGPGCIPIFPSYVSMRKLLNLSVPQFPLFVAKKLEEKLRFSSQMLSSLSLLTPQSTAVTGLPGQSVSSAPVL